MTSLYETTDTWVFPETALTESITDMAEDGRRGSEGIVLWAGTLEDGVGRITHVIGLHGPLIQKRPLQMHIDPDLFSKVSIFCAKAKIFLLGQIHSHPGTFTDLSETDKKYGIATPNFLSVVAPHYAQKPLTTWAECGVHVFEEDHGFHRLSPHELENLIVLDRTAKAPLIHLG